MENGSPSLPPGFRFHPTDEELILHYLLKRTAPPSCPMPIIADVDIYKFNPWELPDKAKFGDREWYYFTPRVRKYPNGVRPNRAAASGYWKATGTDKPITTGKEKENIGVKKALVFYKGKPPKGVKTNWIMHEYRLLDSTNTSINNRRDRHKEDRMRLDDWVLCRIYQKTSHQTPAADRDEEGPEYKQSISKNSSSKNKMHKSFSLSELLMIEEADFSLLSRLIETPLTGSAGPDPASIFSNTGPMLQAVEPEYGGGSKRKRMTEQYCFDECGSYLNSSRIYEHLVNQFDHLSQPFFY